MGLHTLLIILLHLSCCLGARVCPPDQRDALLEFANTFAVNRYARGRSCDGSAYVSSYSKTASWNRSVDCCGWGGVTCDDVTGNIIGLDLKCSWLQGTLHSNSTLFRLRHLRMLDLASNDFLGSRIPPEINALKELTHLNLSFGQFSGHVPSELSHLAKLRSLDISMNFQLRLEDTSLEGIAQNLTALRVVDLSWVDMSNVMASSLTNFTSEVMFLGAQSCELGGVLPRNIFHLPNLRHLDFRSNEITGSLPESNWTTPLVFLDLSYTWLRGRLLDSVCEFKNLKDLCLDYCGLTGILPTSLGNLTGMTSLKLSGNDLIGHVPSTLGNLNQLMVLHLSGNNLSGKVDFGLFSGMKDLRDLRLTVEEILDYESSNYSFPKLDTLVLPSGKLTQFPYFLRSLDRLTDLDLSGNEISGSVPSWFWNVSRNTLETLELSDNRIEGSFQFPWPNLLDIRLGNNMLQGRLQDPPPQTRYFEVSDNNFSGMIPNSFCQLPHLLSLNLSRNNLFGTLPSCLGNSTNLFEFDLSNNNFHGKVPRFLANSTKLSVSLNLSYNSLEDTFPSWMGGSTVEVLDLKANKFHGNIGLSTAGIPFRNLFYLDISNNYFQGSLPTDFFLHSPAFFVDLSDNHFHGPLPLLPPNISFFSASKNKFTEEIPSLMCSATDLIVLDLSNNSLTGTLPPCIINWSTNLSVLNLRMNKIGGIIPEIFVRGSGLRTLDLSRNRFEGSLPTSLQTCRQLEVLDLSNNLIEDMFPNWLATLPELQVLILRSNKFHGILNSSDGQNPLSSLRILDLSKNNFSGLLPESYFTNLKAMMRNGEAMSYLEYSIGRMTYRDSVTLRMKGTDLELERILSVFTSIDLSTNNFWGPVPTGIGNLKSLKGLNLSGNSLTGSIPTSLSNLTNLEWLDLSANKLDGAIPKQLADLTSLAVLNLSENQLTGPIPSGKQFNTFNISSFCGNPGLCGFPLPNTCSEDADPPLSSRTDQETRSDQGEWLSWQRSVLIGYWPGLVLGISLGYIFIQTAKPAWLASFMDRIEAKFMNISRRKARSSRK